jgi:hypothetical protein
MYEFEGQDNEATLLQRHETMTHYELVKPAKYYKLELFHKSYLVAIGILVATFCLYLIPTTSKTEAEEISALQETIGKELELIEKQKNELLEEADMSDEMEATIEELMDELEQALKDATSEEDAKKALSLAEHQLEALEPETMEELGEAAMEQLEQTMTEEDATAAEETMEALEALEIFIQKIKD